MPPSLLDLQGQRAHKYACITDLLNKTEKEGRVLTTEEQGVFDDCEKDLRLIDKQIDEVQATLDRRAAADALREKYEKQPGRTTEADPPANRAPTAVVERVPASALRRSGTLKAFKGPNCEERAYRSGMWVRATLLNDLKAQNYCVKNGLYNALGTTPNSAGGFLVPEEFSQTIIDLRETYGVFRRNTRVVPMGRDTMLVPRRSGGVTIYPIGENPAAAITQSQPSWSQVRLTAKKCGGLTLMSTEVAEDAVIDMADWLANEAAYAFSLFEDQCGFIGDGTSTYLGIRGLANILVAGTLIGSVDATSGHDLFSEIDITDLQNVMSKLPEYARRNAKWYCSAVALDMVFGRLMANAGGNTIQNMEGGYGRSYMGYPIVVSQVLPTSTSAINDVAMLYFGDLAMSSTMGDRRDMMVFPSEHRYMDTDQIGIRFTSRFDIVNHDYGDTTVAGPIVALVGNT